MIDLSREPKRKKENEPEPIIPILMPFLMLLFGVMVYMM